MNIIQEGHAEKLEYGWWEPKRGHVLLPRTLGQKNNFVLSHEELAHYDLALVEMHKWIESERERVASTLIALRKGRVRTWDTKDPTCYTLAHILEGMIALAKCKLNVMHVLNYIAQKRVQEKRADEQGSPPETHEGA